MSDASEIGHGERDARRTRLSAHTGLTYRDPDPELVEALGHLVDKFGRGPVCAVVGWFCHLWTNQDQLEFEEIADGV